MSFKWYGSLCVLNTGQLKGLSLEISVRCKTQLKGLSHEMKNSFKWCGSLSVAKLLPFWRLRLRLSPCIFTAPASDREGAASAALKKAVLGQFRLRNTLF